MWVTQDGCLCLALFKSLLSWGNFGSIRWGYMTPWCLNIPDINQPHLTFTHFRVVTFIVMLSGSYFCWFSFTTLQCSVLPLQQYCLVNIHCSVIRSVQIRNVWKNLKAQICSFHLSSHNIRYLINLGGLTPPRLLHLSLGQQGQNITILFYLYIYVVSLVW